jgi:hypothetical protein
MKDEKYVSDSEAGRVTVPEQTNEEILAEIQQSRKLFVKHGASVLRFDINYVQLSDRGFRKLFAGKTVSICAKQWNGECLEVEYVDENGNKYIALF